MAAGPTSQTAHSCKLVLAGYPLNTPAPVSRGGVSKNWPILRTNSTENAGEGGGRGGQNPDNFVDAFIWLDDPEHKISIQVQRSAKRRGCLLGYSQAEPGRELTQPSPAF